MINLLIRLSYWKSVFLIVVCLALSLSLFGQLDVTGRKEVIEIGNRKQLFIDEKFIDRQTGISLVVNPPCKANSILTPETAIETLFIGGHSQMIRMKDEWWLYYTAVPKGSFNYDPSRNDGSGYMICLATSKDGLSWQRKNINLYKVHGVKENNIVIPSAYGYILTDPKESGGYPYWFFANLKQSSVWKEADGCDYSSGLYLLKSKDGIRWIRHPGQALPFYMDMPSETIYDPKLGKYVAYLRSWIPGKGRTVTRLELDDFLSLPWPHKPLDESRKRLLYHALVDEIPDVVMQRDPDDPPGMDIYVPGIYRYDLADNVYLAFSSRYRHYDGFNSYGRDQRGKFENDGVHDIALSVSRDGIHWTRFPQAYVDIGQIGSVDGGDMWMVYGGMISHGRELWQYYSAMSNRNNVHLQNKTEGAIIRLVQRLDGFVSADAGSLGGDLTTPVLKFEGNRLQLNIDCGAMGEAWVEIQDANGNPIPGFSLSESISVDRNGIAQEVWWQKGPDVTTLVGKPVRLHIKMRSAKLYAFQFTNKP